MDNSIELDQLKAVWQSLDRRLQLDNALRLGDYRDRTAARARSVLRPLVIGQIAQMLFGLVFILFAATLWSTKPDAWQVIVAGAVVHAYGLACIVMAAITLGKIRQVDYASPVLDIQKKLSAVSRIYILSGMVCGLPWWFLWVPLLMTLVGLGGGNLATHAPGVIWWGMGVGLVGLLATAWFHRWARQPQRAQFGRKMDEQLSGASLRKARAMVEELERFERD